MLDRLPIVIWYEDFWIVVLINFLMAIGYCFDEMEN